MIPRMILNARGLLASWHCFADLRLAHRGYTRRSPLCMISRTMEYEPVEKPSHYETCNMILLDY